MSLRIEGGGIFNFNVNATAIVGEKNKTIGAIVTLFEMTDFKRNKEDLEATARELEKTQSDVERKTKELSYLTSHDPFTGCINRRTFFRRLDRDLDTAMLDVGSLSLFVVDLDDFKAVNERYGPVAADSVLLAVSSALKSACSGTDYVARIGGQDFGVVRSSLSAEEAIEFVWALQKCRAPKFWHRTFWVKQMLLFNVQNQPAKTCRFVLKKWTRFLQRRKLLNPCTQ
jgi:diguanylate cyclase (GGDEF)-like protein